MPSEGSAASSDASASRGGSLAARAGELPRSAWWLVAANVVPLVGVVALGWDLGTVMVLFWAENIVVGFYAILRTALVTRWLALFLVPFFTLHYGMFTLGHGVFVFLMFATDPASRDLLVIVPGVLALVVSHGASFVTNFLRGGELQRMREAISSLAFRKTGKGEWQADVSEAAVEKHKAGFLDAGSLMTAPYRRIVVLHVTIIFGGFALLALGSPVWALALLVVLKSGVDLHAHLRERKRIASARAMSGPQPTT